jgi:hypothetical protein
VACVARLRSGESATLSVTGSGQNGTVMANQYLKVHPVPRTKGQPRLKFRPGADAIGRPRFNFTSLELAAKLLSPMSCVYRKLKLGRSGGEVRQGWRVI